MFFQRTDQGHRARRSPRTRAAAWSATVAAVAAAAIIPFTANGAESGDDYVALGDSYSAGTGAGPYMSNSATIPPVEGLKVITPPDLVNANNGNCQRSVNAYSALAAKEFSGPEGFISSFTFAACAGAVSADVRSNQVAALNKKTTLVTLTVGGNDIKFADTMKTCVLNFDITGACQKALDNSLSIMRTQLKQRLVITYGVVQASAPNAKLVVLGYPSLFDENGTCSLVEKVFNPSSAVRKKMNETSVELNQTIHDAVAEVGGRIQFSEAQPLFDGHGVCSAEPFLTEPKDTLTAPSDAYHPNTKGHAAYSSRLGFAIGA